MLYKEVFEVPQEHNAVSLLSGRVSMGIVISFVVKNPQAFLDVDGSQDATQ